MEILYEITKRKEGFVAVCTNINVVTQGDSLDDLVKNLKEAITLHFKSEKEIGGK